MNSINEYKAGHNDGYYDGYDSGLKKSRDENYE